MQLPYPLRAFITTSALCSLAGLFAQSGTLDQSFNTSDLGFGIGDGFSGTPQVVVVQPDDRILVGGNFTRFNTAPNEGLIRLLPDGTVDPSYNPLPLNVGEVATIALQPDGKILVGGLVNNYLTRLMPNGQQDPSFDPGSGPNGGVSRLVLQPDGKVLVSGAFSQFDGSFVPGLVRLNADGSVDPTFTAGLNAEYATEIELQPDGKILLAGSSFFPFVDLVRLNPNGVVDGTFSTGSGPASGGVDDLLVQPDGKILVAGNFTMFDGQALRTMVRLETDGSLDPSFNCGTGGDQGVRRIALRPDGRIVCGGMFNTFNGTFSAGLVQLLADGSLDPSFQTSGGFAPISPTTVFDLALKPDGSVIVIGGFGAYADVARNHLARILDDGTLDPVFHRQHGVEDFVNDIAVRADGRVMIVGGFSAVNDAPRPRVARLFQDGTLDPGFTPDTLTALGNGLRIAVQLDDKVLVLGQTSGFGSVATLLRMNTDGSVDPTFDTGGGFEDVAIDLALQPDGRCIVAGDITEYDGVPCGSIVRIMPDGAIDPTFDTGTGFNGRVYTLDLQADGKVIAGGTFTSFNGASAFRLARLNTDGSLDASFTSAVNTEVRVAIVRPDGRILVGYGGSLADKVACLTTTGALDPTFSNATILTDGSTHYIFDLALLSSGEIAVVGNFAEVLGAPRNDIAVLTADGALSTAFDPGAGFYTPGGDLPSVVISLAVQADDRILAGGNYSTYDGIGRNRLARINYEFGTGAPPSPSSTNELMVWPVPSATGRIEVKVPADLNATGLRITSMDSRTMRTRSISALPQDRIVSLSTEGLAAGSYLLTLSAGEQKRQRLFVVE